MLAEQALYVFQQNSRNMMQAQAWLKGINGSNCAETVGENRQLQNRFLYEDQSVQSVYFYSKWAYSICELVYGYIWICQNTTTLK